VLLRVVVAVPLLVVLWVVVAVPLVLLVVLLVVMAAALADAVLPRAAAAAAGAVGRRVRGVERGRRRWPLAGGPTPRGCLFGLGVGGARCKGEIQKLRPRQQNTSFVVDAPALTMRRRTALLVRVGNQRPIATQKQLVDCHKLTLSATDIVALLCGVRGVVVQRGYEARTLAEF